MAKVLMKGNEAFAAACIKAGADAFFGYPITPQNEIPEYLSKAMIDSGKVFVQAESEVASINMVYGAAGAGARAVTSSSSPGIALMQEGITYLAGAQLPCLIISVMRGGPGLGSIQPSQGDYNQAVKGGGNGDYHTIVYSPETIQESIDVIKQAFDVAELYRNPVMVLVDGIIGQMMEAVDLDRPVKTRMVPNKDWAAIGTNYHTGPRNIVNSLYIDSADLEKHNIHLQQKYKLIEQNEQMYETFGLEDAEYVIFAYGTMARICRSAIKLLKEKGIKVGMIKPITLWPFPKKAFEEINPHTKGILVCEMSCGQMINDVIVADKCRHQIGFFGRAGGIVPEVEEVVDAILNFNQKVVR